MDVAKLHKSLNEKHKKFVKGLDPTLIEKIALDRSLFVNKVYASVEQILNILKQCGAIDHVLPRPFDKFVDSMILFEIQKQITLSFAPHLYIKAEFPDKIIFSDKVIYVKDGWEEKFANELLDVIHENFYQNNQYRDMLISKKLGVFNAKNKRKHV